VQCSGGTTHHRLCNLVRIGGIHIHPRPLERLEDERQATQAGAYMDAELGFPGDRDVIVAVDPLHTGSFAFFLKVLWRDHLGPCSIFHSTLSLQLANMAQRFVHLFTQRA
jgi:hypothetical protein